MLCIAQAIDIFATGFVAGAFYTGTVAVHPATARLDAPSHLLLSQELIRRLQRALSPFMLLPVPAVIAAVVLCPTSVSWPVDALGCALSLATIGITVTINAPLSRRFARWSPPSDWQQSIHQWNVAHVSRMTTAICAFASAILAGS